MKRTLTINTPVSAAIEYTATEHKPRNIVVSLGGAWNQIEALNVAMPDLAAAVKEAVIADLTHLLDTLKPRDWWSVGTTKEYIEDYPFALVAEIPEETAKHWLGQTVLAHPYLKSWTNKGFVLVGQTKTGRWEALYLHDDTYYIAVEK